MFSASFRLSAPRLRAPPSPVCRRLPLTPLELRSGRVVLTRVNVAQSVAKGLETMIGQDLSGSAATPRLIPPVQPLSQHTLHTR